MYVLGSSLESYIVERGFFLPPTCFVSRQQGHEEEEENISVGFTSGSPFALTLPLSLLLNG